MPVIWDGTHIQTANDLAADYLRQHKHLGDRRYQFELAVIAFAVVGFWGGVFWVILT